MEFLGGLWLPIIVATVIVFVASSIMHMVLPYHRSDYKQLPEEEKAREALRGVPRGLYSIPYCTHQTMKSPEIQEKFKQGPIGLITIFPTGLPVMPKCLGQWLGDCLCVSFFVAYLTYHAVAPGSNYLVVFRVAGAAGFMAYSIAHISDGIWRAEPWGNVVKEVFDGLVYGLLTAGTFGWLWPHV